MASLIIFSSIALFKSVFGNDVVKAAKDRGLKTDADVVHSDEQDGRPTSVGSAKVSDPGLTDSDEFQGLLHGSNLIRGFGPELIVRKAEVILKISFPILYRNELHCANMEDFQETLQDLYNYGFYICVSHGMNAIGNKSREYSSKNTSEQGQKEVKARSEMTWRS